MKWLIILTILTSPGCAVYTLASTATWAVTGKSVGDHTTSLATQNDCNSFKYVTRQQDYLCEQAREPGTTYNRTAF
jgi:hypothetical protein